MMAARQMTERLIDRLPPVRGSLTEAAPLAKITWFRVGGPAEVLFRPVDVDDLVGFLRGKPADVAVCIIGVGSNILVRDGGVDGVVIRLGRGFTEVEFDGTGLGAGAAAPALKVALAARRAGLAGLEFLAGIPGTVGGGLRMNAGAYDREMTDVVTEATALDPHGNLHRLTHRQLGFAYRRCAVAADWIFTAARLKAAPGDKARIADRIAAIRKAREDTQPTRARTGGSTFVNPPRAKAWELIDRAGCRGLRRGGAMVSEKHCNFLINTGAASAADIEDLGEEVRRRVHTATGVRLQWEIQRVGRPRAGRP